ncbi:alpha/beta-hydrolase [Lojkania enalia]|uniref:Alpha/beta-hydrolase n=1 Tax=Lojkania enalia TaxID=147567 RepID=A0A9P4KGD2_9PLEO|nr:alpha/beta-hydrolase [Didymosphaeria enalia]
MHEFIKSNEFFNFELTRILGTAPCGGCEVAEFLEAVGEIKSGDLASWHKSFQKLAEKAERLGESAAAAGNRTVARDAFLRASNYYRASGYMMFDRQGKPSSSILPIAEGSIAAFQKSLEFFENDVKLLEIPYEYQLPGYLYLPPVAKRVSGKTPIIVCLNGADSTQEELYFTLPSVGPDLGYAVLTFEGPGQGILLRRNNTHQRPDWEVVTSAVLDFLITYANGHPELNLDTERIAVFGITLGGYYALRSASDSRIKACVSIDAFYDMWDLVASRMPPGFARLWTSGWIPDFVVNGIFSLMGRVSYQAHWEFSYSSWMLGVSRPVDLLRTMRKFTFRLPNDGEFLDKVRCPVFASGAAYSVYFDPELAAGKIMSRLKHLPENAKEIWIPKDPGEGGLQAKVGAWTWLFVKTFAFLDRQLGIEREHLAYK